MADYEVIKNGETIHEGNDFKTAVVVYATQVDGLQRLDMPSDEYKFDLELRINPEKRKMRMTFEVGPM